MGFTELSQLEGSMAPCAVLDLDLSGDLDQQAEKQWPSSSEINSAWVLVRRNRIPVARLLLGRSDGGSSLADILGSAFPVDGKGPAGDPTESDRIESERIEAERIEAERIEAERIEAERKRAVSEGPEITAVVCTFGSRKDDLRICLSSLTEQEYERFKVLVVDNNPTSPNVKEVFSEFAADPRFIYTTESSPGLSYARNASLRVATSPVIAWFDDDEIADPLWLLELARAYVLHPEASVVCGLMAPAELDTAAQVWFEQWGGHSKGSGFDPIFYPGNKTKQNPLYPLPSFASGGNMSYRKEAIEALGGFDVCLGAGTLTMGAEDTLAFTESLLADQTMIYWPSALTFHRHRSDLPGLERQLVGYGTGLTAYYTSIVLRSPRHIPALVKLLPKAISDIRSPDSLRNASIPNDFPPDLMRLNRNGMAKGPFLYLKARYLAAKRRRAI